MKVVVQLSNFAGELDREEKDFEGEADPDAVDDFATEVVTRWTLGVGDTIRIYSTDEEGEEVEDDDTFGNEDEDGQPINPPDPRT